MLTPSETLSMLTSIKAVHGFIQTTPEAVATWRDLLGNVTIDAVRDALRVVMQESSDQPTPASILRAIRSQRGATMPVQHYDAPGLTARTPAEQAQVDALLRDLRARFSRN
jgi:hypothetical protein